MSLINLCVQDLIAAQAAARSGDVALVAGATSLTYADLNSQANQLAFFLRRIGVGPETLVGLCTRRTAEMVVGMVGILKAGAAYVPLDPDYPSERLSFMLRDSGARVVITTGDLRNTWTDPDLTIVRLDADATMIRRESESNPASVVGLENLAYVIYTSGSTGQPKGAMITHGGLMNYLRWAMKEYGQQAKRSALVHSSISFDLTVTGLYVPLLLGGRVELLPEDSGVDGLLRAVRQSSCGLVKITPAHLELLSQRLNPGEVAGKVGLFVIGGENLRAESLRFWREFSPTTRLINEYGPTETVVGCCAYEVQPADPQSGSVPIGKPIDNTRLYILDPAWNPVPAGTVGELYIGGAGVARGYLNRPELTQDRFLADPFCGSPGDRMYRSGDLARVREDGCFEYLGRLDDQVKIRGFRIELGEIEASLLEHSGIHQSVVMVREDEPENKQLVAYAIRQKGQSVTPEDLREFLKLKLPTYMVPARFAFVDTFPLTPNGKVDRRALPPPGNARSKRFSQPRNPVESELVAIWEELLGVSPISTNDNFFDLGGHSLLVAKLLVRSEQVFGKRLSMATLFEAPTIRQLGRVLRDRKASASRVIPIQPDGKLPPFFCFGAGPLFRPLAHRLGRARPFLSLMPTNAAELKQLSPPYTLAQIAAYAVDTILEYQREGPYYLGGWSASGVVAYEAGRQLEQKGHEVALLVLFDTLNPATHQPDAATSGFESRLQKMKFFATELRQLRPQNLDKYLIEKVQGFRDRIKETAFNAKYAIRLRMNGGLLENSEEIVRVAVNQYQPLPYSGRVAFFGAAARPAGGPWDFSQGWRHLVSEFEVHQVPGDHRSMFVEPNVDSLAAKLSKAFVNLHARRPTREPVVGGYSNSR